MYKLEILAFTMIMGVSKYLWTYLKTTTAINLGTSRPCLEHERPRELIGFPQR